MAVNIVFEAHATSFDNEAGLASGWHDVALSELGENKARELGLRRAGEHFDVIFCSDLQRSYRTAEIAFKDKFPILRDARLRECSYGELDQVEKGLVDEQKGQKISTPFPGGESYEQTCARMQDFLDDVSRSYDGKRVMIIGHRATQYGLEHSIKGVSIVNAVTAKWQYQPGWKYELAEK